MTLLESPPPRADHSAGANAVLSALSASDRILQRERGASGLLRCWPWFCGFVLAAFALDVVFHFPAAFRAATAFAFVLWLGALLAWQGFAAWRRRNPPEHTARVLERRDPHLGSKLINFLQLREQSLDLRLAPLTRQMAAEAVADYAEQIRGTDLLRRARTDAVRAEGRRASFGLLGLVAVLGAAYDVTRTEFPRFIDPFGDHPPYSFSHLEIADPPADGAEVTYGESLLFTVRSSGHRPKDVLLSSYPAGQPERVSTAPMFDKGEHGFVQQIQAIHSDLIVFAHTPNRRSVSRQRRISVQMTPKLAKAWVKITPPAYTGLGAEETPLQFKSLKVLEGSEIEFRLLSNRPLYRGNLEIVSSQQESKSVELFPSGENEVRGAISPTESARLRFTLTDFDGRASDEKWDLTLNVVHDLPPEIQITNPPGDSFVAMDFKIDVVAEASDDYGLKTVRIQQARNGKWVEPRTVEYKAITRNAREAISLDFKQMDIVSGDTFSFFAEAVDTAPMAHLARSSLVTLTVISTEEYNAFLRERLDLADIEAKYSDLFNKLHDLTDEQRKLGDQIDALKQETAGAKDPAALASKLDTLLAKQNELNGKLDKLADTMDSTVRAKPLYDVESDLQQALKEKAEEIRDSTAKSDRDAKDVAEQSSKSDGSRQMEPQTVAGFKQASDAQVERLSGSEKGAREEVEQPLEDMSLMQNIMEDLNHFDDLYEAQKTLEQQAKAYDKQGPLSRADQLALQDLAATEKDIGGELDAVEQKLWEDGKAAEEKFPKAAQGAKDIAQKMGDLRLQRLASQAAEAMVGGNGNDGAQLASRLRGEMDKLYSECKSRGGQMSSELDQYLRLTRPGMKSGNNFQQMMQSHKFGGGKSGFGKGQEGRSGRGGSAVTIGPNAHVLGNETAVSHESAHPGEKGMNQAKPLDQSKLPGGEKPDVLQHVPAINRESGSIQGESSLEQYSDIVDKYFKAITKPAPPAKTLPSK